MSDAYQTKQEKIQQLLEMQRKFIAYEHEHGVEPAEYWSAPEGHELAGYKDSYMNVAMEVVELAHNVKGSNR